MCADFRLFQNKYIYYTVREQKEWRGKQNKNLVSLLRGGRQWAPAFCCIQVRIHSTINIKTEGRLKEKTIYGHKTLYIRVKYTMQHGEKTKNLHIDSTRGKRANKTWTHSQETSVVLNRLSWGQFWHWTSTVHWLLLYGDQLSRENHKNWCHVMSSKTNQPRCFNFQCIFYYRSPSWRLRQFYKISIFNIILEFGNKDMLLSADPNLLKGTS